MISAVLSPRARREFLAAVEWIAKENPVAAEALRSALANAVHLIGTHSEIGTVRPHLTRKPYRFLRLAGFPYLVVYDSERRPPLIVRVVHGVRDLPEVLRDL